VEIDHEAGDGGEDRGAIERGGKAAGQVARAFADRIAANGPQAIRLLKRTLADPSDAGLDAAFDEAFGGPEFSEGYKAFREKRRPEHK
jgi:enoyl-CoA hydratase/carnithine racemase